MVKNQIVLEFGYGDIGITPAARRDGKEVGLFLTNVIPGKVGRPLPGLEWDPAKADAVLTFNNVESIDVLIKALKAAKKMMEKGGKKKK